MNFRPSSAEAAAETAGQQIAATEIRCEDEPIRIPGAVQQHGFVLITGSDLATVLVASENAEHFLRLPLRLILGARLETLLERELQSSLQLLQFRSEPERTGLPTFLGSFRVAGQYFSVVAHTIGSRRLIEFELQDRLIGPEMMNGVITNFVGKLGRLRTELELCEALTVQVAELTGFDRVLLYSFDHEEHGTVLTEVNNGRLPSYLGLRFPASDIPKQARELYVLNTVRIIPDAGYTPSPLQGLAGEDPRATDLSMSLLRSVSPLHLQYMRNMGTMASMSVSLVLDGRLWGLISAHNSEPKLVPYLVRSACDMLSKVGGTQLAALHTTAKLAQTVRLHAVQRNLMAELAVYPNYIEGLAHSLPQLLEVTNAGGVALVTDGQIATLGEVPDHPVLQRLAEWLEERPQTEVWSSGHLSGELPWMEPFAPAASGLLAIRLSSRLPRFILWFRPEVVNTVRWAGEPEEIMEGNEGLSPRHSFAEWKEVVRGRSVPWSPVEIESARDFQSALTTIGLRRAEETIELGEARFQQLTQALPMRVFTADDAGRLTFTNERWRAASMGSVGRWFEEACLVAEDEVLCRELWAASVARNQSFEAEVRVDSAECGADKGPGRWNFVRVVPFHRQGAAREGWIGCFVDLTERKEREIALRMNEKLALTGRMTSVIAHEINNPLEAITNLMYLLRTEIDASGPAVGYIALVESELERISGITKQTLRWNRESSSQREHFPAGDLVDDVLRLFAGKIRNRQITTKVEGDRAVRFYGVLGQLRQVLANLISNAVDAAPVAGHVTVRVLEEGGRAGFAVRDNGRGIPPHVRTTLFQPFCSTKGDLGNGLGLYISHEIVERHGGVLDVADSTGQGTEMRFLVPVPESAETIQGPTGVVPSQ